MMKEKETGIDCMERRDGQGVLLLLEIIGHGRMSGIQGLIRIEMRFHGLVGRIVMMIDMGIDKIE
jgi:hypothetical protein